MTAKTKILIAEDEAPVRNLLHESLSATYEIVFAANGQEAVEAFFQNPVEAILMDINMPILDGCQAIEQIRLLEGGKDIPIVVLTALESPEWEEKSKKAGASIFMTKPFKAKDVAHCLKTLLQPRHALPKVPQSSGTSKVVDFKVSYQTPKGFLNCYVRNLLDQRSFLETDKPLPLGSRFNFEITPPRGEDPFTIVGVVKWVNLYSGQKGMGVQFTFKNPEDEKRIQRLVHELEKSAILSPP